MNILIINPPIRLTDKPRHIPHGLAIIANMIRRELGVTPQFLDLNAYRYSERATLDLLKIAQFDVVLIGGLIPVYKRIITLVEDLKRIHPACTVIAGGSAAMSVPDLLLRHSQVDAVCAGEGELAIVELLRGLQTDTLPDVTDIPGFYFKLGDEIIFSGPRELIADLDQDSALPAYDLLPMDIYLANPVVGLGRDLDVITGRGCPFRCTFCYQPWGRKFRAHSIDFVLDALKFLKKTYQIDFVSFQDDEFMAQKGRVVEFCERVQRAVPGLLWSCTGRVNLIDDDLVRAMRQAGCVSISYGFESGSPRMLNSMRKMATIDDMEQAAHINRKFGMMLPVSFIIGMPGEDDDSCRETVEFCVRNNLPLKSMMFATPYPGTELFDFACETGRIRQDQLHEFVVSLEDARDFTVNLTDAFTDDELIAKREDMIREVCARVPSISPETYMQKMGKLFGHLADDYFNDDMLLKHRAEHGGLDVF
jgi:anaerobic magnesium-protoporphyrin IX monomethyl ester cyclase